MSEKSEKKVATTYKEVDGDALDLFFNSETGAAFMHGANCHKVMGAGIADQVRQQVSPLFYIDQYDARTPSQRFGSYSAVVLGHVKENIKIGVNLYSQFSPGANFDITALRNALKSFVFSIPVDKRSSITVYLPKIGCGIGGGTWDQVEPVIQKELAEFNIIVVNYKPKKTDKKDK